MRLPVGAGHRPAAIARRIPRGSGRPAGTAGRSSFLRPRKAYSVAAQGNAAKTALTGSHMLDKTDDISAVAANWLAEFETAIAKPEASALERLFHPDSYWRDVLALSWNLQTIN